MTDAKKAVALPTAKALEPSNQELAELQAVISQGGTELNPAQVKITWLYAAKRGLDVISRQLIPTVIRGKLTFITTIDGFRVIAERSGDYAGQDPIKYGTKHADGKGGLEWAEATVYRHSWGDRGLTVRAYWDEFVPDGKGDYMWKKMPHVMLGKVAEAQALRKAFPNDMSGMYSDDEMSQAGVPAQGPKPATPQELAQAQDAAAEGAIADEQLAEAAAAQQQAEILEHNETVVDEEEAKATGRKTTPRRRGGISDAEWAQRLRAAPHISDSQRKWLADWDEANPDPAPLQGEVVESGAPEPTGWDGVERRVEQSFPHPGRRSTDMPDDDVDPSRGGSTEPQAEPYPELPADPEPERAAELPVYQGDEGSLLEGQYTVVSSELMTTGKGNEVVVTFVQDREHRYEVVQAAQLAKERVAQGQVVDVKGTWTDVGGRLIVLAMHVRGAVTD